jgi:hypothetical protein
VGLMGRWTDGLMGRRAGLADYPEASGKAER